MSAPSRRRRSAAPTPVYRRRGPIIAAVVSVLPLIAISMFALDRLLHPNAFRVEHVRLEGDFRYLDVNQLEQAVLPLAGGNFFAMDLDRIERAAESLPWVYRASVRRYWPWSVEITVREHEAGARWNDDAWLNVAGDAVELPGYADEGRLPRLRGPAGSEVKVWTRYREFSSHLGDNGLRLSALELSARGSWQLVVEAPVAVAVEGAIVDLADTAGEVDAVPGLARFELVLGRHEVEHRLERFVQVWPGTLAADAARIERIDFRYPNGFALRWRDGENAAKESGA